jgi:hypothetical protein
MSLELEVPSMKSLKTYYIGIDISKDKFADYIGFGVQLFEET